MLPATTIVILAAIVLLVLLVAASYYRHAHGYRAMSLTCHRFRYRSRKAAMLASMDDAESDSDDEEAGELSPVPSGHFSRNASASDFVQNGGAAAEVVAAGKGSALLLQLPTELWLEVLGSTGPYHHHVVCALRESCHAMRRHLQGTPFWYCLCKQAFAPWEAWMSAIGWDDYGACAGAGGSSLCMSSGPGAGAGAGAGRNGGSNCGSNGSAIGRSEGPVACAVSAGAGLGAGIKTASRVSGPGALSSVTSRAWQHRYVSCCRDRLLLRAAARQIASASSGDPSPIGPPPAPTPPRAPLPPASAHPPLLGSTSPPPAATLAAAVASAPGTPPAAGLSPPNAAAVGCRPAAAPGAMHHPGVGVGGALISGGWEAGARECGYNGDRGYNGECGYNGEGDEGGEGGEGGEGFAYASVFTGAVGLGRAEAAGCSEGGGGRGGFLSMRGYHVAELPALRPHWGGRGPTQSQMAKALMRRQQGRVDWLLSAVAQSSRTQRRLVPVWKRVHVDDLPGIAPLAFAPMGTAAWRSPLGAAAAMGTTRRSLGGTAEEDSANDWLARMRRLHALLASGGAGAPECWVALLAKGDLSEDPEAPSRTTCWMLVLCSTRHAVWVDYMFSHGVGERLRQPQCQW